MSAGGEKTWLQRVDEAIASRLDPPDGETLDRGVPRLEVLAHLSFVGHLASIDRKLDTIAAAIGVVGAAAGLGSFFGQQRGLLAKLIESIPLLDESVTKKEKP